MTTYWVRLYSDPDNVFECIDVFKTGENGDGSSFIYCFAIQANEEQEIHDLLSNFLCYGTYTVDFIQEKPEWSTYRDFCGPGKRFVMNEEYIDDPIDTISQVLDRLENS